MAEPREANAPAWEPYAGDLDGTTVIRLTLLERVQHIVLMTSFTVLIITGIPLLFPKLPMVHAFGGVFPIRTFVHRFAGATLAALAAFHVLYVLFSPEGRRDFGRMAPRWQDVKDFVHFLKFQLGRVNEPPPFGKFDPFEKIEYFAVVWGSAVMVATGFMLWFFEDTLRIFPFWVYQLVLMVHGYEALLAFLAIILWHLYNVHLKPGHHTTEQELRSFVAGKLAGFKVPVKVVFWPEMLPRNANGKILKTELKKVFATEPNA